MAARVGNLRVHRLSDGSGVIVKRSRMYESDDFWYGLTANTVEQFNAMGVTHVVFVLGDQAYTKVPLSIISEFLPHARTVRNPDGSVQKYMFDISGLDEPILYSTVDGFEVSLAPHLTRLPVGQRA